MRKIVFTSTLSGNGTANLTTGMFIDLPKVLGMKVVQINFDLAIQGSNVMRSKVTQIRNLTLNDSNIVGGEISWNGNGDGFSTNDSEKYSYMHDVSDNSQVTYVNDTLQALTRYELNTTLTFNGNVSNNIPFSVTFYLEQI